MAASKAADESQEDGNYSVRPL